MVERLEVDVKNCVLNEARTEKNQFNLDKLSKKNSKHLNRRLQKSIFV